MKKILIVLLIALLVLSFVSCRRAREQAAENMVENMIENMIEAEGGGDVDIDIDSDGEGSVTIESDEGEVTFEGDEDGMPWPDDKLPSNVPKVKGVKVVSVMDAGTGVFIAFEGITAKNAEDYIKAMEANGWEIGLTVDQEGTHNIMAGNDKDEMLQFTWEEDGNTGGITYGKN